LDPRRILDEVLDGVPQERADRIHAKSNSRALPHHHVLAE
jgi:hypothetical protein